MTDDDLSLDAEGALEFPCRYPVKIMTRTRERALDQVLTAIASVEVDFDREQVKVRPSRNGRFQSLTVEVDVASRRELEAVYASVRALDIVVMTL